MCGGPPTGGTPNYRDTLSSDSLADLFQGSYLYNFRSSFYLCLSLFPMLLAVDTVLVKVILKRIQKVQRQLGYISRVTAETLILK